MTFSIRISLGIDARRYHAGVAFPIHMSRLYFICPQAARKYIFLPPIDETKRKRSK